MPLRSCFRRAIVLPAVVALGCSADVDDLFNDPTTGGAGGGVGGDTVSGGENSGAGGSSSDGGAPAGGGGSGPTTTTSTGMGGAPPTCGDGVLQAGEACDGSALGPASCLDYGFTSPAGLSCTGGCDIDASGCTPTCDGVAAEPGEVCDGFDLQGQDCTDYGYADPDGLFCNEGCSGFVSNNCNAQCGNGLLEPGETCDGNQVLVTCQDFGFSQPTPGAPDCNFFCDVDPQGCENTCGDGNLEPTEQCDDGNTVSGDGCSATCNAEGTGCDSAIPVVAAFGGQTISGNTSGGDLGFTTASSLCPAGAAGPSRTYAVTVVDSGFLTAWLDRAGTAFDSVLYARTTCADDASTILCADSSSPLSPSVLGGGEVVSFPVQAGDVVYLVVDGIAPAAQGAFSLTVDISSGATCQDPVPLPVWSGSPMTVLGFTTGKTQSTGGSCGGGGQGNGASDVVYRIERMTSSITNIAFELPIALTNYDSILYGRFDCNANEIVCNDDPVEPAGGEAIALAFVNNAIRYVWVDGFGNEEGDYGMTIAPTP